MSASLGNYTANAQELAVANEWNSQRRTTKGFHQHAEIVPVFCCVLLSSDRLSSLSHNDKLGNLVFCSQCGASISEHAKFCSSCGASAPIASNANNLSANANFEASVVSANQPKVAQVRPWVRYWARMFDVYLASLILGIAVGIFYPAAFDSDALNSNASDQLFAFCVLLGWVFIESMLLSTVGTTPGKWLFKAHLNSPAGGRLSLSKALSRSFKVWWRGLGIGIPIVSLITLIVAHRNLTTDGVTTWDRDDGFSVTHERIGPLRTIFAILFFVGFFALVVWGSLESI